MNIEDLALGKITSDLVAAGHKVDNIQLTVECVGEVKSISASIHLANKESPWPSQVEMSPKEFQENFEPATWTGHTKSMHSDDKPT